MVTAGTSPCPPTRSSTSSTTPAASGGLPQAERCVGVRADADDHRRGDELQHVRPVGHLPRPGQRQAVRLRGAQTTTPRAWCASTPPSPRRTQPVLRVHRADGGGGRARTRASASRCGPANRLYAFNYVSGQTRDGHPQQADVLRPRSTAAACAGQPYAVDFGAGTPSNCSSPLPTTAAIGDRLVIPIAPSAATTRIACYDASTQAERARGPGRSISGRLAGHHGAPIPLLTGGRHDHGLLLPERDGALLRPRRVERGVTPATPGRRPRPRRPARTTGRR